jgi:GNAT superfamily N-acetyltransferase
VPWEFTEDVARYAAHVWELLARHPEENTAPLTVIENLRVGRRWSSVPPLFGWCWSQSTGNGRPGEAGRVTGAVSMTPPQELLLGVVPPESVADLVHGLRTAGVAVPGVNAETSTAEAFAAAWTADGRTRATMTMHQRLYRLSSLRLPVWPPGSARPAVESDLALAADWFQRFEAEAGLPATDVEPRVRTQVVDRRLWLWADPDGVPVALAGRHPTAAGVARVGPVYTPPEHRRRGYGAAVTAACTQDVLRRDADQVVLFTDLENPTSNSIYQQMGFVPVRDDKRIRFDLVSSELSASSP